MRLAATSVHLGEVGWLPCIPFAYNEMTGEPISQCSSISDQNPCSPGEGPFAYSGYCPTVEPGFAGMSLMGLRSLRRLGLADVNLPAIASIVGDAPQPNSPCPAGMLWVPPNCLPPAPVVASDGSYTIPAFQDITGVGPCTIASGANAGAVVPCPDNNSVTVTANAPTDWSKWMLYAALGIGGVILISVVAKR